MPALQVFVRPQASRVSSALTAQGIAPGDRVAAYMPNMPETIAAMLGGASRGAIFSSCSPDFGVEGAFGLVDPVAGGIGEGHGAVPGGAGDRVAQRISITISRDDLARV